MRRSRKSSWRIARIAGVDVDVHWSFSLIILWVIAQSAFDDREIWNAVLLLIGVLLVFICVMLHELGHAVMALSLNVPVKKVMLLPFGGLAQIQPVPDRPVYEFLIAVSGPLVNLALLLILLPVLAAIASPAVISSLTSSPVTVVDTLIIAYFQRNSLVGLVVLLMVANAILFAFNLIPAFPMDGGRMLQSILALFLPYGRATQIALGVGLGAGALLALWAVSRGNMILLIVAIFILFGARTVRVR